MKALIRGIMVCAVVVFMACPVYAGEQDAFPLKKDLKIQRNVEIKSAPTMPLSTIVDGTAGCVSNVDWTPLRNSIYSFMRLQDGSCRGVLGGPEGEHISYESVANPSVCDDLSRWFIGQTNEPGNIRKISMYGCTDGQIHPMPEGLSVPHATGYIFTKITQIRFY